MNFDFGNFNSLYYRCDQRGQIYQPVLWAGFSWQNLQVNKFFFRL